ncbi:MAG: tRNA epoxyqueuosine(34) reductase QueG [Myxococcales bacterium]|nr:tRNA epoxyqueuosine(34) reductase QueG [Myxococcales bacterium]USN50884.1 MAG: tRNA epoxyqueuosine(34) reductase QueG [Myxococcales bacterium]
MSKEILLKEYATSLGFDDMGIASVDGPLPFIQEVKQASVDERFGPLDYLYRTLPQRLDVRSFFPIAQSVIVVIKNYYTGDHPTSLQAQAKIARYAWGHDYHQWFKKRLKNISNYLQKEYGAQSWIFNDTGPFLERSWALKAGLGFIGKSAMFIHREFGTWTFIGGVATDLNLQADEAYTGPNCGTCTRCIDACPTKAIIAPHTIEAKKCISTWTIERTLHSESIALAPRNHEWAFGCDVCQEVCPWNKFEKFSPEPRFQPVPGRVFLNQETFNQDLKGSPLYRTKKVGLRVNLIRIQKTLASMNHRDHQY